MTSAHKTVTVFLCLFFASLPLIVQGIWPMVQELNYGTTTLELSSASFAVATSSKSSILQAAIVRYNKGGLFFPFAQSAVQAGANPPLKVLQVNTKSDSEQLFLGVDESYALNISLLQGTWNAVIDANTVFGAMRGLETFAQLIVWTSSDKTYTLPSAPISINDYPRFPWRGLLIDTSRHYLDVSTIKRAIDAMSYNKLNTLHWHVTDAQSFPVVSEAFPNLSKGAWSPNEVYKIEDIKDIVTYALGRGIRVVPEFDMPGHFASWGVGYPSIIAKCPNLAKININDVSLNPSDDYTYTVLKGFLTEMSKVFPDSYFHIGGDEVDYRCWMQDPNIVAWMNKMGFTKGEQVVQYFEDRLRTEVLNHFSPLKNIIVWQEIFTSHIQIPMNTTVEVWISQSLLQQVLKAGYPAILSAGWYLDKQIPNPSQTFYAWTDTWKNFYNNEPFNGLSLTKEEEGRFLGGEASMWAEQVDSTNFDSRVWPRCSATAERLWSAQTVASTTAALPRLINFRCRLAQRGIGAGPLAPGYCPLPKGARRRM